MSQSSAIQPAFWRAAEALHSVVYFAEEARTHYPAVGLRGFWRGYFASRAAALGTPSAELVTATFFGFAPAFVARAVPEVWQLADRDEVLAARRSVATEALAGALGDVDVTSLGEQLSTCALGADLAGKPLAAAHSALEPTDDPLARLWQAATVLRELRGDCHVAVLVSGGVDGAEANVLALANGLVPETQQEHRGWTDDDWLVATDRLRARGWVAEDGSATAAGRHARADIEQRTHTASNAAIREADVSTVIAMTDDLVALSRPLESRGPLVYPNPTAVARP